MYCFLSIKKPTLWGQLISHKPSDVCWCCFTECICWFYFIGWTWCALLITWIFYVYLLFLKFHFVPIVSFFSKWILKGLLHGSFQLWAEILMTYQGWNLIPWYRRNQLFFIFVLHDKIFSPGLSLPQGWNFQASFRRRSWSFSPGLKIICAGAWVLFHK